MTRVPAPGVVIDRYQVESMIGAGSMGDVVGAIDMDLKRKVAIKILSEKHRDNPELEARFVREGRAVAAISHANVVQVFTTGTYDGRPYIAMELLTGTDLGSYVVSRGPLSSLHAARALLDSARGLQAAANAGLIHRDVKPSNLVMLDTGVVKVTDFGLAKPIDPKNEPALTAMGVVVGTPDYIAPEQARGESIDERVDLYALGGTLYYLLIGNPPFRKGNPVDDKYLKVVARHLKDPAPNPLLINNEIDGELARLQLRLMSKSAEARPSYNDLISELVAIVNRLSSSYTQDISTPTPASSSETGPSAPTPFLGKDRSRDIVDQIAIDEELVETARTKLRLPTSRSTDPGLRSETSLMPPLAKRRSRPLLLVTIFSAIFFLVGLGLFLFGPLPSASSKTTVVVPDAGAAIVIVLIDAAPVVLVPPEGMVLVPATDHHDAFFIARSLVSYGDFADIFPNQKKPTKNRKRRAAPVTSVSFPYAQAFVRTKGGRLPTPVELLSAQSVEGFDTETGLWEWTEDGTEGTQAQQTVGFGDGRAAKRRPRAHQDVGFRLVIEP